MSRVEIHWFQIQKKKETWTVFYIAAVRCSVCNKDAVAETLCKEK